MFDTLYPEQQTVFSRCADHIVNHGLGVESPRVLKINAPAGNGKTYTLRALVNFLSKHLITVSVHCYTGRAASQLAKDGFSGASTLHSLLYEPILDADGNLVSWNRRDPATIRDDAGSAIILDEVSMLPRAMYEDVAATGLPLILCGDQEQLPSITGPNEPPFDVLSDDVPSETISLIQPRRHQKESGILDICQHLRETNSLPRKCTPDRRAMPKARVFQQSFHDANEFDAIIAGTNKTVKRLNNLVRKARGHRDLLPDVGEIIMCIDNDVVGGQKINNGELFRVTGRVDGDETSRFFVECLDRDLRASVRVHNNVWMTYKPVDNSRKRKLQSFVYGYAMTCHKAQGSTFERLLFVDEDVSFFLDQRRYRYTGVSRASQMLYIGV